MGQFTEAEHVRKGLGRAVLEAALEHELPLLSDRSGLTFKAFRLWHKRAMKGGAAVIDMSTGERRNVSDFKWEELWNNSCSLMRPTSPLSEALRLHPPTHSSQI